MVFDKILYDQIVANTYKIAKDNQYDDQPIEDIVQDVAIIVMDIIKDHERTEKIKNRKAYIRKIIKNQFANHFRQQERMKSCLEELTIMREPMEDPFGDFLNNQVPNYFYLIDEYIRGHPKSFTPQNLRLWNLFKLQRYSAQQMMGQMGMKKRETYYTAKARLLKRIATLQNRILPRQTI